LINRTAKPALSDVVLIVDDDRLMAATLKSFLQPHIPHFSIIVARNGAEAMTLCTTHRPRLVLMDVRLPDADGIDLTAKVKAALPETAVVIISSNIGKPFTDRARAAGALAYVAKEHIYRDLLSHIRGALIEIQGNAGN
jgi:DNA-binding NarL/FixJ family response regulator